MVKIAISGGSGGVGFEIVDALAATGKHEILILSRKDVPPEGISLQPGVTWTKADYGDVEQLTQVLQGVHTVFTFIVVHTDPDNQAQKNLIDASVRAGVKRFAPSEWVGSTMDHMPWTFGKLQIRDYLKELNRDKKVLEYCLFQPGFFLNYLTYPHRSAKHLPPTATPFDFYNRRAIILEGSENAPFTITTVQDLANVVAEAVDYQGEWPVEGGIRGNTVTAGELIAIGERVRGGPFKVERLQPDDLKAGVIKSSWKPAFEHPTFTPEQIEVMMSQLLAGIVLGMGFGAMEAASDNWNRLLPRYKFTDAEEFLGEAWSGKD